jgi:anti-sigma-K factor RskA
MTEHDRPTPGHCGDDVAAYALGALSSREAESLRAHLETCPVCADELAAFGDAVEMLAASAPPQRAPRGLRRRVMRAVADEPRLDAASRRRRDRQLRFPRPAFALTGATALAALIVALVLVFGGSGTSTRVVSAEVSGHGQASLRLSGDHAQLIVNHFTPAPQGDIYEVWTERGSGNPQPTAALFGVTRSGEASVAVPGNMNGVSHVLVTAEPAGGTKVPTTKPVIEASLG